MPDGKWSDDRFLDTLRGQGDPLADAAIERLVTEHGERAVGPVFDALRANDSPLPADAPPALHAFMLAAADLPPGLDHARLQRGGTAFLRNALPSVVVLLAASLPRGYAAPCLCEVLSISGNLARHPYDRLMGVVQLLVNITDADAFSPAGRAVVTARKLRLLHAGIRRLTPKYRPAYTARFGVPVNHEDMLATILAFSYLLVIGVRRLGLPLPDHEAEDLYYLWRVFALLMGIHPVDAPHDDRYIPATLADAAAFYAAYVRRNDTSAAENAYGVELTRQNLAMMTRMVPLGLRLLGGGFAPRICMTELLDSEELARVGYRPLPGHRLLRVLLSRVLRVGQDIGDEVPLAGVLASHVLQAMVAVDRRGEVQFSIPFDRIGLRGPAFR